MIESLSKSTIEAFYFQIAQSFHELNWAPWNVPQQFRLRFGRHAVFFGEH